MASKKFQIGRDAINGQFMTVEKAKKRPRTTTVETIKIKKKK